MTPVPVVQKQRLELGLLLQHLTRALSHRATRRLGRCLGALRFRLNRRRRKRSLHRLALALPDATSRELLRLAGAGYRQRGALEWDLISATRFDSVELCRRLSLEGWEHVVEAEGRGRGLLLLSVCLGSWEMANLSVALYRGPVHAAHVAPGPLLSDAVRRLHDRFPVTTLPPDGVEDRMAELLARRERVALLLDPPCPDVGAIPATLCGIPLQVSTLPARISLRSGAPVVLAFGYLVTPDRYRVLFHAPIDPLPGRDDSPAILSQLYLKAAEAEIRPRLEVWFWALEAQPWS